ncbi:hypothetical protein EMIT043CA1_40073 [Pseudomonas brassicacearum]
MASASLRMIWAGLRGTGRACPGRSKDGESVMCYSMHNGFTQSQSTARTKLKNYLYSIS